MTIVVCPDCAYDLVDETDLCSTCLELCASSCDCLRREQCDDCAAREDVGWEDA